MEELLEQIKTLENNIKCLSKAKTNNFKDLDKAGIYAVWWTGSEEV